MTTQAPNSVFRNQLMGKKLLGRDSEVSGAMQGMFYSAQLPHLGSRGLGSLGSGLMGDNIWYVSFGVEESVRVRL